MRPASALRVFASISLPDSPLVMLRCCLCCLTTCHQHVLSTPYAEQIHQAFPTGFQPGMPGSPPCAGYPQLLKQRLGPKDLETIKPNLVGRAHSAIGADAASSSRVLSRPCAMRCSP